MVQTGDVHIACDCANRLRRSACFDCVLIAVPNSCLNRRYPDLGAPGLKRLVKAPTRTARGQLDNDAVRIGKVDRLEVDAVIWSIHRNSLVCKPALPLEQYSTVLDDQRKVVGRADAP